jgi:hypothetical protein
MSLGTDLRVSWRATRRNRGFSVIAIATLAFAIGANTAIFTVVDAILLRPRGYGDESRLFVIHEVVPKFGLNASLVVARLFCGLLYGVAPADAETIASVILILGTVAAIASLIPALRASHVNLVVALRYE